MEPVIYMINNGCPIVNNYKMGIFKPFKSLGIECEGIVIFSFENSCQPHL